MPMVGVLPPSRGAGARAAAGDAPDATTSAVAPFAGDDGHADTGADGKTRASMGAAAVGACAFGAIAGTTAGVPATGVVSAGAARSVVRDLSRRAILGSSISSPAGVAARATVAAAIKIRQAPAARRTLDRPLSFPLPGRS